MAEQFQQQGNKNPIWKARRVFEAMPGDILIYIDPLYNPDPNHREPDKPSGTHVAFIDEILEKSSDDSIKIRLIDSSKRRRGRGFTPDFYHTKGTTIPKETSVAYSILSIKLSPNQENGDRKLYECHFFGQRKQFSRFVLLLYKTE